MSIKSFRAIPVTPFWMRYLWDNEPLKNNLSFASKVTTSYNGRETGIMHACGYDAHVAILMGVAEILSGMKKEFGKIMYCFYLQ